MKPFDLEKAKAGAPVCTRNGYKVEILSFDVKNPDYPIAAIITLENGIEIIESYTNKGEYSICAEEDTKDLMMVPIKHKGWVNIYPSDNRFTVGYKTGSNIFPTKERAMQAAVLNCITTIPIEWEE